MAIPVIGRAKRAYDWWLSQLSAALVRTHHEGRPWRTMLFHGANGLEIFSNEQGSPKILASLRSDASPKDLADVRRSLMGKADRDSKQVMLRLSQNDVVQKTIRVPHAALDLMNSVVENKIETIVPWSQENTYYGYRIVQGKASGDQIDALVMATSKQLVDRLLGIATDLGLAPRSVDFAASAQEDASVELLSLEPDPVIKTARRLNIAFISAVCCAVSVGALGAYRLWTLEGQYTELDGKVASIMTRVDEVKRLNDENEKLKTQRERLATRKSSNRPVMELIEALSRALPDTAYVDELEIHENEARLVGKSADPTGLIGILEATPEFQDVRFSAPTTKEDGQSLGTFSIVGNIQQKSVDGGSK